MKLVDGSTLPFLWFSANLRRYIYPRLETNTLGFFNFKTLQFSNYSNEKEIRNCIDSYRTVARKFAGKENCLNVSACSVYKIASEL